MDTWQLPYVQEVTLRFAPQSGKTQAALNCLLYAADYDPGPAFYIMPDETDAKRISRRQIIPAFKSSPRIRELLSARAKKTATLSIQLINGMDVTLGWATSAASLASESYRYLFFDEPEKYPPRRRPRGQPHLPRRDAHHRLPLHQEDLLLLHAGPRKRHHHEMRGRGRRALAIPGQVPPLRPRADHGLRPHRLAQGRRRQDHPPQGPGPLPVRKLLDGLGRSHPQPRRAQGLPRDRPPGLDLFGPDAPAPVGRLSPAGLVFAFRLPVGNRRGLHQRPCRPGPAQDVRHPAQGRALEAGHGQAGGKPRPGRPLRAPPADRAGRRRGPGGRRGCPKVRLLVRRAGLRPRLFLVAHPLRPPRRLGGRRGPALRSLLPRRGLRPRAARLARRGGTPAAARARPASP